MKGVASIVILLGVIALLAIGTGMVSMPAAISGAYSAYPVSFDSSSSSAECRGSNPEFIPYSEILSVSSAGRITPTKTPKTMCGYSSAGMTWDNVTRSFILKDLIYTSGLRTTVSFSAATNYATFNPSINMRIVAIEAANDLPELVKVQRTAGSAYLGVCIREASNSKRCLMSNTVSCGGASGSCTLFFSSGNVNFPLTFITETNYAQNIAFIYTVPREDIPQYLHYRQYSCPLPPGYYLVSDTFAAGTTVTTGQFGYPPAFFCERHPAIVIDSATSASYTDTSPYVSFTSGQSYIVPAGNRITIIYATTSSKSTTVITLESELQQQIEYINSLQVSIAEKAAMLEALELNLVEQAAAIDALAQTSAQQAAYIDALTDNINEQAALIAALTHVASEQAAIIDELELSVASKAALILQLQATNVQQAAIISSLNMNIADKARLIDQLTATSQEQAQLIAHMQVTLAEKAALISQLTANNEEQAELLALMDISFAEQGAILAQLNLKVADDASVIQSLTSSNSEQAAIIAGMQLTIQQQAALIVQITSSTSEQASIIQALNLHVQQDAQLIQALTANNQQQAAIIAQLTQKASEQGRIIANMQLTLSQQAALISALTNDISVQAQIIAQLHLSIQEEQAIAALLHQSIEEQQALIGQLHAAIAEKDTVIGQLSALVSSLQQQIYNLLHPVTPPYNPPPVIPPVTPPDDDDDSCGNIFQCAFKQFTDSVKVVVDKYKK